METYTIYVNGDPSADYEPFDSLIAATFEAAHVSRYAEDGDRVLIVRDTDGAVVWKDGVAIQPS